LNAFIATGTWPVVICAMLAVLAAGIVSALSVASLSLMLPMAEIVPTIIMLEVAASLVVVLPSVWRHVRWPFVFGLTLSSIVTAPLGIWVLQYWPAETVRVLILFVILAACVLLMRGFQLPGSQPLWRIAAVGAVAGAVNAAGAVGGLIYSLFLVADGMPPVNFRASLALIFLLVDALSAGMMMNSGLLVSGHLSMAFVLLLPTAIGVLIGSRVFHATSPQSFRRFAIMLLMSLAMVGLVTVAVSAQAA